jgi:RNA polymerase sigma factor (sigma-70 family)
MLHAEDQTTIKRFLRRDPEMVHLVEGWILRAAAPFRQRLGADWEDVLQDIRIEIARLLERGAFRGEASLKTYVWRVANHACLHRVRAQTRRQWIDIDELNDDELPVTHSPLDDSLRRESAIIALRVLAELSDECRSALQMVLGGASYREMSHRLGIAEGALRVKVLRCRRRALALRESWLSKKI